MSPADLSGFGNLTGLLLRKPCDHQATVEQLVSRVRKLIPLVAIAAVVIVLTAARGECIDSPVGHRLRRDSQNNRSKLSYKLVHQDEVGFLQIGRALNDQDRVLNY